ncbi:hypothetical protein [Caudoviricetes sp.]|nr:hypothetical protein [Caudoviricetes sp.]
MARWRRASFSPVPPMSCTMARCSVKTSSMCLATCSTRPAQ